MTVLHAIILLSSIGAIVTALLLYLGFKDWLKKDDAYTQSLKNHNYD